MFNLGSLWWQFWEVASPGHWRKEGGLIVRHVLYWELVLQSLWLQYFEISRILPQGHHQSLEFTVPAPVAGLSRTLLQSSLLSLYAASPLPLTLAVPSWLPLCSPWHYGGSTPSPCPTYPLFSMKFMQLPKSLSSRIILLKYMLIPFLLIGPPGTQVSKHLPSQEQSFWLFF